MKNFFTTSDQNEIPEIVEVLIKKEYCHLESAGKEDVLFINKDDKSFWLCSDEVMNGSRLVIGCLGDKIEHTTLNDIEKW